MRRFLQIALYAAMLTASSAEYQAFAAGTGDIKTIKLFQAVSDSVTSYLKTSTTVNSKTRIERAVPSGEKLKLYFNRNLKDYPLRDKDIRAIRSIIDGLMPSPYTRYEGKVILFADDVNVDLLESRFYSGKDSDNLVTGHYRQHAREEVEHARERRERQELVARQENRQEDDDRDEQNRHDKRRRMPDHERGRHADGEGLRRLRGLRSLRGSKGLG